MGTLRATQSARASTDASSTSDSPVQRTFVRKRKCACGGSLSDSEAECTTCAEKKIAAGATGDRSGLANTPSAEASGGGFIVDDDTPSILSGQARKSDFLEQIRSEACAAADRELARAGRDTEGCPYVERMLQYSGARDASHLERAIRKFAPGASTARSASDYLPVVSARFAAGVASWVETGTIPSDLPPELQAEMMGGAAVGAIGGTLSALGQLFFWAGASGGRHGSDRRALSSRIGTGEPLERTTRARMESAFGYNFDRVRVHSDSASASLSREL